MAGILKLCHAWSAVFKRSLSATTQLAKPGNIGAAISRTSPVAESCQGSSIISRFMASLAQMHRNGPHKKVRRKKNVLDGSPYKRGLVLKVVIKKPKKPNSANRKCVLLRLSNGQEATAYIPREGHNLQEHSIVLVRGGRLQDVPGVNLKCIRGKFDLGHVKKDK